MSVSSRELDAVTKIQQNHCKFAQLTPILPRRQSPGNPNAKRVGAKPPPPQNTRKQHYLQGLQHWYICLISILAAELNPHLTRQLKKKTGFYSSENRLIKPLSCCVASLQLGEVFQGGIKQQNIPSNTQDGGEALGFGVFFPWV